MSDEKWSVTANGAHVLVDIGMVVRTHEHRWRVYTVETLGDLTLGPFDTLEEAKAALETIARRVA